MARNAYALPSALGLLGCGLIVAAQLRFGHLDAPLFMLFFWCVLSSRYLGTRAAIVSIATSTLLGNFFFLPPYHVLTLCGIKGLISGAYAMMALLSLGLINSILRYGRLQNALLQTQKQISAKNAALAITLNEAVVARDNFVAIAGHELKTPLTALYMHTQVWQRRAAMHAQNITSDKLQKSWEKQLHSVERIVHLVEQLLDVSRIDSAPAAINLASFTIKPALVDLMQRFSEMAAAAGCSVSLHGSADVALHWDQDRFDQVMSNLLSNAIKYAPRAPIRITWSSLQNDIRISVRDGGPGIAQDAQERIFARYQRLQSARDSPQGLGLGLWISRELVTSGGGSLKLCSTQGPGSEFVLTLPSEQLRRGNSSAA